MGAIYLGHFFHNFILLQTQCGLLVCLCWLVDISPTLLWLVDASSKFHCRYSNSQQRVGLICTSQWSVGLVSKTESRNSIHQPKESLTRIEIMRSETVVLIIYIFPCLWLVQQTTVSPHQLEAWKNIYDKLSTTVKLLNISILVSTGWWILVPLSWLVDFGQLSK